MGVAIILFTIVARLVMWPLVKKQLHNTKKMRELQPELRNIKKLAKGDKAKEAELTMALYKEREVNPFSSIGLLLLQLPVLFALYAGLRKIVLDPHAIIDFSYPFVRNLPWMKELAADITKLDFTLFGVVDLTRKALSNGVIYWPAMVIVLASAVVQYLTSSQLMVTDKNARTLRQIMRQSATSGEQADQAEVSAAVSRLMRYIIPFMIFFISVGIAAALALYWLASGAIAYIQQSIVLRDDKVELEAIVDKTKVEAEVIPAPQKKKKTSKKNSRKKKRR